MPLPQSILHTLQASEIRVEIGETDLRLRCGDAFSDRRFPALLAPEAWLLPLPSEIGEEPWTEEKAKEAVVGRLRQAGIQWLEATVVDGEGQGRGAVLLLGVDRRRSLTLGYKLGLWAIFQVAESGVRLVYTGKNSRMPNRSEAYGRGKCTVARAPSSCRSRPRAGPASEALAPSARFVATVRV
jgi:hypothetical protein